jgi:catechol-2,3-dioxygenase
MSEFNKSTREELERINISKRDNNGKLHYYKEIIGVFNMGQKNIQ